MNKPTPEQQKAIKEKVIKAEKAQKPFEAKYGKIMMYVITNN